MTPAIALAAKLGGSLIAILLLAWAARWMGLGGDVRIHDENHARTIANDAVFGFVATDVVLDKAGIAALLRDAQGRQMLIRRHGAMFVGRLLDASIEARLDQQFLTIGSDDRMFGRTTLNLGDQAQYWAAGLRHLPAA